MKLRFIMALCKDISLHKDGRIIKLISENVCENVQEEVLRCLC
jgi:hypothetical protein